MEAVVATVEVVMEALAVPALAARTPLHRSQGNRRRTRQGPPAASLQCLCPMIIRRDTIHHWRHGRTRDSRRTPVHRTVGAGRRTMNRRIRQTRATCSSKQGAQTRTHASLLRPQAQADMPLAGQLLRGSELRRHVLPRLLYHSPLAT